MIPEKSYAELNDDMCHECDDQEYCPVHYNTTVIAYCQEHGKLVPCGKCGACHYNLPHEHEWKQIYSGPDERCINRRESTVIRINSFKCNCGAYRYKRDKYNYITSEFLEHVSDEIVKYDE